MVKLRINLFLAITFILPGCKSMFVTIHIREAGDKVVFHLDRRLSVSEAYVERLYDLNGGSSQREEYWRVINESAEKEQLIGEIKYGEVPLGYYEATPAKPLVYGYYDVIVSAKVHNVAAGKFAVIRTRDKKMTALDIDKEYENKEALLRCLDDKQHKEESSKIKCFESVYQGYK